MEQSASPREIASHSSAPRRPKTLSPLDISPSALRAAAPEHFSSTPGHWLPSDTSQGSTTPLDQPSTSSRRAPEADGDEAASILEKWDQQREQQRALEERRRTNSQAGSKPHAPRPDDVFHSHAAGMERTNLGDLGHPAAAASALTYGLLLQPHKPRRHKPGADAAVREVRFDAALPVLATTSSSRVERAPSDEVHQSAKRSSVAKQKARRNSYSIGYGVGVASPSIGYDAFGSLHNSPQSLSITRPSIRRPSTLAELRKDASALDDRPMLQQAPVVVPSAEPPARGGPEAASQQAEPEAKTFGDRIRRLVSRSRSRAHLLQSTITPELAHDSMSHGESPQAGPSGVGRSPVTFAPRTDDDDASASPNAANKDEAAGAAKTMGTPPASSFKRGAQKGVNNLVRPLTTLPPFVPRLLREDIALNEAKFRAFDQVAVRELVAASKTLSPTMTEFQGAVMIADVKGFTQLTEILSKKGTAGVELLTNCMNNYFTRVINMINAFDGDVVKFAGDSMIVAFNPSAEEAAGPDQGIRAATSRCAQCSHVLATRLGHMRMKMNGQVEPINVAPERVVEVEPEGPAGNDAELIRRNSGPSMAAGGRRARGAAASTVSSQAAAMAATPSMHGGPPLPSALVPSVESPRSSTALVAARSTVGGAAAGDATGEELSTSGSPALQHQGSGGLSTADNTASPSDARGSFSNNNSFTRRRSKGWIQTALMRKPSQMKRESAASGGGGSNGGGGGGAAASSQQHSRRSIDSSERSLGNALGGTSKRSRAKTEVGGNSRNERSGLMEVANMFGPEGGGMAVRELSLASKLNIPPSLRVMGQRPSGTMGSGTGLAGFSAASASQPGGSAQGAVVYGPRSFTGDSTSPSRRLNMGESWQSKFQSLQSSVTRDTEVLHPERSRLSYSTRGTMQQWGPLTEEGIEVSVSNAELTPASSEDALASGAPFPSQPSRTTDMRKRIFGRKVSSSLALSSMQDNQGMGSFDHNSRGSLAASTSRSSLQGAAVAEEQPAGEGQAGAGGSGFEWSEDSYTVDVLHSGPAPAGPAPIGAIIEQASGSGVANGRPGFKDRSSSNPGPIAEGRQVSGPDLAVTHLSAPGPVAEGWGPSPSMRMEDPPPRGVTFHPALDSNGPAEGSGAPSPLTPGTSTGVNSRIISPDLQHRWTVGPDTITNRSLLGKVVSWFSSTNSRNRDLGAGESFTNARHARDSASTADGSQPSASAPSFGHPATNYTRMQPTNNFSKARDPVMEEVQNSTFSLKIMVSAGSVCVFHVGGNIDEVTDPTMPEVPRWEFFIGDRPLAPLVDSNNRRRCIAQLAAIEDQAEAGEVVISREVMDLIQDDWEIEMLPDDVGRMLAPVVPFTTPARGSLPAYCQPHIISQQKEKERARERERTDTSAASDGDVAGSKGQRSAGQLDVAPSGGKEEEDDPNAPRHEFSGLQEHVQRRVAGLLRMHVLGSVRSRIEAGHLDFINEIRPLTCIFLGFPSLLDERDTASHSDQISCVQFAVQEIQNVMRKWDGSFLQFRCDEKGFVGICAFGLPGHTHEDNPSRGILAALELHKKIKEGNHRICVGVTTGDLLCTCVGARKIRSEYTVFGDAINLSARLMVKCKNGMGDILCDEPTHRHAKYKANYEELEPLPVKGKKMPVIVYRVTPYEDTPGREPSTRQRIKENADDRYAGPPERPLIGRDTEMSFILNRAANMIAGMATGGAIVIEGNTGMGKTKLLSEVRKSLDRIYQDTSTSGKPAFHVVYGIADIANKSQKLHPWRRIFHDLFTTDARRGVRAGSSTTSSTAYVGGSSSNAEHRSDSQRAGSSMGSAGQSAGHGSSSIDHGRATSGAPGHLRLGHKKPSADGDDHAPLTQLGDRLASRIPSYNVEWRRHLAELLDIPQSCIPCGARAAEDEFVAPRVGSGQDDLLASIVGATGGVAVQGSVGAGVGVAASNGTGGGGSGSTLVHQSDTNVMRRPGTGPAAPGSAGPAAPGSAGPAGCSSGSGVNSMGRGSSGRSAGMTDQQHPPQTLSAQMRPGSAPIPITTSASIYQPAVAAPTGATSMGGRQLRFGQYHSSSVESEAVAGGDNRRRSFERSSWRNSSVTNPSNMPLAAAAAAGAIAHGAGSRDRDRVPGVSSSIWRSQSAHRSQSTAQAGAAGGGNAGGAPGGGGHGANRAAPSGMSPSGNVMGGAAAAAAASPMKKNSLNFLVHIIREFTALHGPIIILLENLHEFDTWSWQLLVKVSEVLGSNVLTLATTRPNEPPAVNSSHHLHGKAALYQKVAMMYRHLLRLPTTSRVLLEPFTFAQTKALMQVVADVNYPDQYVMAVLEKTGGMPLYIEKVTEFLCQKPWLADQGGEFAANVNKMIRNLNFQQVIIERMDRLKPGIHLTLKVASVMGQWVDLDILHKFYPINKSREELRGHLVELERGNFLKPTDTEGVWEFNMVERDIVYEVIPHYQRRRLHAKLAQELERSLEEHHVATLTTIAYHWNQACMGHEVTEVECALKAIEYWQRAADAAYSGSSLMEALRLYQKAAQIAEVLGESMGDSFHANRTPRESNDGGDGSGARSPDEDRGPELHGDGSFTAVGSTFRGQLNWSLISRITRAQWEKSMASCCLGIVMQHRYEFNNQMEYWDTEDYFTLLTEHAIRGLMLLGAPHPKVVLNDAENRRPWLLALCCGVEDTLSGWQVGIVLQDQEVTEIRDILLVLIIAAEHYSMQHDGEEYTRLLTFCKRVCKFFNKCSDTGLDPFTDIRSACSTRIKNFKSTRGTVANMEFGLSSPISSNFQDGVMMGGGRGQAQGIGVGPEFSQAVLGPRRFAPPNVPARPNFFSST